MTRAVLWLALVAMLPACATRGTLRELGHPEFEHDVPKGQKLTVVEPTRDGEIDAFPSGANETADHSSALREDIAPHVDGDNLVFSVRATSKTAIKLDLIQVLVYPLAPQDALTYQLQGTLPDAEHPIAAFNKTKDKGYIPGTEDLGLDVSVPLAAIKGADRIATPTLLRFEDGWVTIVYRVEMLPKP